MNAIYMVLAKRQQRDMGGNINLLGIYNRIPAPITPCRIKDLPIFMRFVLHPDEFDVRQHLGIQIVDEDGQNITSLEGDMTASLSQEISVDSPIFLDQVFMVSGLLLPRYGGYAVNLFIENELKISYPFQLVDSKTA